MQKVPQNPPAECKRFCRILGEGFGSPGRLLRAGLFPLPFKQGISDSHSLLEFSEYSSSKKLRSVKLVKRDVSTILKGHWMGGVQGGGGVPDLCSSVQVCPFSLAGEELGT